MWSCYQEPRGSLSASHQILLDAVHESTGQLMGVGIQPKSITARRQQTRELEVVSQLGKTVLV